MTKRIFLKRSQDILAKLFEDDSQEEMDVDDPEPMDSADTSLQPVSKTMTAFLNILYINE